MDRISRAARAVALFAWACLAAPGQDLVFVFHEGPQASVYDANTLALLGRPEVGPNALGAIGVPDPANPGRLHKIYVVTRDAVVTLGPNAPYPVLARNRLGAAVNAGRRSAKLSADGRWLLVAADRALHAFRANAPAEAPPILIPMGGEPTSLAILPDSTHAFVTLAGSNELSQVTLLVDPPHRLAGPVELPSIPQIVAAAPNSAAVYAVRAGAIFEIDPYRNIIRNEILLGQGSPIEAEFDREAPLDEMLVVSNVSVSVVNIDAFSTDFVVSPAVLIDRVLSPRSNLFYILSRSSRQVWRSNRDGSSLDLLRDPRSNTPFQRPVADIGLDTGRGRLFVGFGDSGLVRMAAGGTAIEQEASVAEPIAALDVVGPPATVAARLRVYGGNGQAGTPNQPLPRRISVQATAADGRPAAGVEVSFLAFAPNVTIRPNRIRTNHDGVATVEVIPPFVDIFEVEARTSAGQTARFELNSGALSRTGVEVLSGDYQIALAGTQFPKATMLRTLSAGAPSGLNQLTITPRTGPGVQTVVCPATATSGTDGIAVIQCAAGPAVSPFPAIALVDVTDQFGRRLDNPLTFTVVGSPELLPREDPIETTLDEIVGPAGGRAENALRLRLIQVAAGGSSANVGVEFKHEGPPVSFDPRIAPSRFDGRVATTVVFGCQLGTGKITSSVNMPGKPENEFAYRVVTGAPAVLSRRQGNNQSGQANRRLDGPGQALVAKLTDACGNPVANVPVEFTVAPPGAVRLEQVSPRTNGLGEVSAIAVLGPRAGPAVVSVTTPQGLTIPFDLNIEVTATRMTAVEGGGQSVSAGARAERNLVVQVTNDLGAGAAGVPVRFVIVQGEGAFATAAETTTDEMGRASVGVAAGRLLGPLVVEARAVGLTARFDLQVIGRRPLVSPVGFVNAASFIVGLSPCSAASIFGTGLMEGVDGVVIGQGAPFPTRLRGVRVLVDGIEAPILALVNRSGQEQINIQVPCFVRAPANDVTVTIENNGVSATFVGVRTFTAQPGVFEVQVPAGRVAAVLKLDDTLVQPGNEARPGEIVQVFWTGGGTMTPAVATNSPGPTNPPAFLDGRPLIRLNGVQVEVLDSVYAPQLLTVYQSNIRIPADAQTGSMALTIQLDGQVSPETLVPVRR